jgi:UbiD family decarboxylase
MPCAIALGAGPVVMFTGAQKLPIGADEAAVAGGLAGVPVPLVKCITQDIDVPADAEIIIEGQVDTSCAEPEGPFGESHGYISLEMYNMPMTITAITQKRSPVLPSIISQVTPSESGVVKKVAYEPLFFAFLRDSLGIKGLKKVVMHERLSNLRPVNFLQFAHGTPNTEVWRALQGAAAWRAECGKIVIAVSEDIDPSNADAVIWSLAYRSDPVEDVQVERYRAIGHYPKAGEDRPDSTMMINATLRGTLPPVALPARHFMESAKAIWDELKMPALSLQPPWHGYDLGDWSPTWDRYAQRAVAGEWQELGRETLVQQQADAVLESLINRRTRQGAP